MRLSLSSLTILSLFAASSHAFAPPKFTKKPPISITSSRFAASNELSGMLSEYKGSAAATVESTTSAVEKVADAVASSTVIAPPSAEVADSGMESLMKAASSAQDAADQAAAAAGAVAAKAAAATKVTATAAGATAAGGIKFQPLVKPLVGGLTTASTVKMPFQVDPSKVTSNNFDASVRARENLALLKSNLMNGMGSLKETSVNVKTDNVSMDIGSKIDIDSLAITVNELAASLHLKEYGGWYVAAAMAVYASQQRTAGQEDASAKFESELANAREKASEAASAAGLAAQGATTAKNLAMKMEKDMKKDGGQVLLESSRSKMVQMEKDIMEKEMRALQVELSLLKKQLETPQGGKKKKKTKTVKTEIEKEYPTKVVMKSDPDEDGRILELLKALDEENKVKKQKAAEELEKKREEEAKFVAAEKKKAVSRKMTKGVEAAQAKAEVAKKKKAATKKAKKASTKAKSVATKKTTATKKAVTKKTVTVTKRAPRATANVDDWASLADSTLKRKTVAQLTEYLSGKGVTASDSSGKSLKKAELLEAVKSL
mmetsp:Transcript_37883/g.69999  ORF Transcript_37883/g.69999 Transcript_37883/m.69999 type:complete len:547 (-) Transcript_37883:290-1930(-)